MPKLPYMQFYVDDWKAEIGLAWSSLAARGCWIEILGAMHQSGRTGVLAGTAELISRVCRCSPDEVVCALSELRTNGVAEVSEEKGVFTIVNRRMRREAKERILAEERQARYRAGQDSHINANKNGIKTENKRKINGEINGGKTELETEKEKETKREKEKESNTSTRVRFSAPTVEEVREYCEKRKNHVDAERFVDFYQSKGWMVGKNPMKDWHAAVRTWENYWPGTTAAPSSKPNSGGLMGIKV